MGDGEDVVIADVGAAGLKKSRSRYLVLCMYCKDIFF